MKKFFYILFVSIITSLSISACTDEAVEPRADNGGGGPSEVTK